MDGKCSCNHAESEHEPLLPGGSDDAHGGRCRFCDCERFTWVGMYSVNAAETPKES